MNIINEIRAAMSVSEMISEGEKEIKMGNTVTPGWKTSEFWLHILTQVPTVLGLILGASNPAVIAVSAVGALASAVYTISRSGLKSDALTTAAASAAKSAATALNQAVPTPTPTQAP